MSSNIPEALYERRPFTRAAEDSTFSSCEVFHHLHLKDKVIIRLLDALLCLLPLQVRTRGG